MSERSQYYMNGGGDIMRSHGEQLKLAFINAYKRYFSIDRTLITNLECDMRWKEYLRARDLYLSHVQTAALIIADNY